MSVADPASLIEFVARSLVRHPSDVEVVSVKGSSSLVLELRVNSEDVGTIIGKGGRIAKAMRTLLTSFIMRKIEVQEGMFESYSKVILEIVDE